MPSAGTTNSYSTIAVIPEFPKSERVVNANIGLYVCPVNKKAKVTGTMVLDAVGADATYCIAVKRGLDFVPVGNFIVVGEVSRISNVVTLIAGDILTNVGDSGSTNGTCDMDCSIQEISV